MNKKLEDVGCVEGSHVTVVSKGGEDLRQYFTSTEDDLPAEPEDHKEDVKEAEDRKQEEEQKECVDDSLVTVNRRPGASPAQPKTESSVYMESATPANHVPPEDKVLPDQVAKMLSGIEPLLCGCEGGKELFSELQTTMQTYQNELEEYSSEYKHLQSIVDVIHYENQKLRQMFNDAVPSEEDRLRTEKLNQNLFLRPVVNAQEEEMPDLPDDVDALKKLVHDKYATALMNERRFMMEKKRCKKYKTVAESFGVNESNVDEYYAPIREVMNQCEQLKEENMNLKEKMRALNAQLDAREDELRRMVVTVQSRDEELKELAGRIEGYDALLKEKEGEMIEKGEVEGESEKEEVKEMKELLKEKEEMLKQKEEEVRMLNEMKNNACEEMERLRSELSKMEQSKQNKKALLETVQKEIDEAKEVISSQEHIIQEKDETIRHLKEALDVNDGSASADAAQLKEENAQLREQLKSVIEENKSVMESENDLVSSLEAALVLLEANVKAKKDRMDALQAAMDGVK